MPIERAKCLLNPASLSSVRVNPLPALSRVLYFRVQDLTMGRSNPTGSGNILAALAYLASYLLLFLPAWLNQVLTPILCQCLRRWTLGRTLLCLTIINSLYLF